MENHEVFDFSHTQFCHSFCLLTHVSATSRVVLRLPGPVPAPLGVQALSQCPSPLGLARAAVPSQQTPAAPPVLTLTTDNSITY